MILFPVLFVHRIDMTTRILYFVINTQLMKDNTIVHSLYYIQYNTLIP